ncbi:nuclear transport factor 2 family protein [Rhizobium mesosinicum]|uniref:Nuclear transport factor 2 family protein n=1 Tax=Rhizobium mesosinicum TaxID=335017 RepID=A0ABS7GUS6_9HYPH|nr:nuclear transport factor 2 family protein [Rhizobium mesosinicum]MBW9053707.1 nuclear transport factor 2 family protein [Rhizobium mesosinicum]
MTNRDQHRAQMLRDLYAAYIAHRKEVVGAMLAEDFTFSSPQDNHIDRATYFERCWPKEPALKAFDIEFLTVQGDEAVVRYRAEMTDGKAFRNMESFRFDGNRIASVDVYFGRNTA